MVEKCIEDKYILQLVISTPANPKDSEMADDGKTITPVPIVWDHDADLLALSAGGIGIQRGKHSESLEIIFRFIFFASATSNISRMRNGIIFGIVVVVLHACDSGDFFKFQPQLSLISNINYSFTDGF